MPGIQLPSMGWSLFRASQNRREIQILQVLVQD
jgi:hypothetical protein